MEVWNTVKRRGSKAVDGRSLGEIGQKVLVEEGIFSESMSS